MNPNIKIDVVIPAHSKDKDTLDLCIDYAKKNVININNNYIYLINALIYSFAFLL